MKAMWHFPASNTVRIDHFLNVVSKEYFVKVHIHNMVIYGCHLEWIVSCPCPVLPVTLQAVWVRWLHVAGRVINACHKVMEQTQSLQNLDHTHNSCAEILWIVSNRPPVATHLHYNLLLSYSLLVYFDWSHCSFHLAKHCLILKCLPNIIMLHRKKVDISYHNTVYSDGYRLIWK